MLAWELLADISRKLKEPNIALKLDMEKAYDKLDWSFLMSMFRAFGFESWFIDLVYGTLSNNWFSILINRKQVGFFKSFCGGSTGRSLVSSSVHYTYRLFNSWNSAFV